CSREWSSDVCSSDLVLHDLDTIAYKVGLRNELFGQLGHMEPLWDQNGGVGLLEKAPWNDKGTLSVADPSRDKSIVVKGVQGQEIVLPAGDQIISGLHL